MKETPSIFSDVLEALSNLPEDIRRSLRHNHRLRRFLGFFRKLLRTFRALMSLPQHMTRIKIEKDQIDVGVTNDAFDRRYIDRFNTLNCIPDIENVRRFNARQITNVMAAWSTFKKYYLKIDESIHEHEGFRPVFTDAKDFKNLARRDDLEVYTNNSRMALFLRHLTKWKVYSPFEKDEGENKAGDLNIPTGEFIYFGINPSRRDLMAIKDKKMVGGVVVGSDPVFLGRVLGTVIEDSFYDQCILGKNKFVSLV